MPVEDRSLSYMLAIGAARQYGSIRELRAGTSNVFRALLAGFFLLLRFDLIPARFRGAPNSLMCVQIVEHSNNR